MIRFRCKECGKKLKADDEIVGRKVKCTRCDSIESVPESDNLAKSQQSQIRLDANKPKPKSFKTDVGTGTMNPGNPDQPIHLFGHSAVRSTPTEHFEQRFQVVTRKPSNLRRWILLGLIGVFSVAVVAVLFNLGWIMDVRRKLSTDYENLAEVVYYRNAVMKLEKSRRMMHVAGRNYIATRVGTDDEIRELEEYDASIRALTTNSDILEKVEALFRRGKDVEAKALLVNTAKELNRQRSKVETVTKEYTNQTKAP
jgi:phage FluMu protein Com